MNTVKKTFSIYALCTVCAIQSSVYATYQHAGYTGKVRDKISHATHTSGRKIRNAWNNKSTAELLHIKNQLFLHVEAMKKDINNVTLHDVELMNDLYDQCYSVVDTLNNEYDSKMKKDMHTIIKTLEAALDEAKMHLEEIETTEDEHRKSLAGEAKELALAGVEKAKELGEAGVESVKSGYTAVKAAIHDATTPTTSEKINQKVEEVKAEINHQAKVINAKGEIIIENVKHGAVKKTEHIVDVTKETISSATK